MSNEYVAETKTWTLAHGPEVLHFVEIQEGQHFDSGQPNVEHFSSEEEAIARAIELDPDWVHPDELLQEELVD